MSRLSFPILISGFIGSGKSTLAKHLAKTYHAKYISASEIHQKIVTERLKLDSETKKIKEGFWETRVGEKVTRLREQDMRIDRSVDQRLLRELKKHPHSVTDARLMPWLYRGKGIRIWVSVSQKESACRVGERDQSPMRKVFPQIRKRFHTDQKIFRKLYGIDMGKDFLPFDVVINTEGFTPRQTYQLVHAYIEAKIRHVRAQ